MEPLPPIATEYEASVARYWDTKRDDQINLLLNQKRHLAQRIDELT